MSNQLGIRVVGLVSFVAFCSLSPVFAQTPQNEATTTPQAPVYWSGAYVEANFGYTSREWDDQKYAPFDSSTGVPVSKDQDIEGGFLYGFDAGYRLNRYWSLEAAWYNLPTARGVGGGFGPGMSGTLISWLVYGVVKLGLPIYENTYAFVKFGGAYNNNTTGSNGTLASNGTTPNARNSDYGSPIVGIGGEYYCTKNVSLDAQYFYTSGYDSKSSSNFATPSANLFTVGLGYHFVT